MSVPTSHGAQESWPKILRMLVFGATALWLAACSNTEGEPVGISGDQDALKRSPCACLDRTPPPATAGERRELERWYQTWREAA